LKLLSARETWLKGGSFDAGRVLGLLRSLCTASLEDGFKGSRIVCDMRWAGREAMKATLLQEWELALHRFVERHEVTLLCLYRKESLPAELTLELARLHPSLIIGERVCRNAFYLAADPAAAPPPAGDELDLFLSALHTCAVAVAERDRLRQELEQAYAALARKIYENWQEEDTLRASERELLEKDEALLEQRRRLQTILQHLPAMLVAFDIGNRLTACNHEFERLTGYKAEEVMGKPLLDLIEVEEGERQEIVLAHPPEGGDYRGIQWSV